MTHVQERDDFHPRYVYPFQDPALSPMARVEDLVSRLTLDEKLSIFAMGGSFLRLGLQGGRGGSEGLHGVAWVGQATVYPAPLGLSQSWDRELYARIGDAMAREIYAYGQVSTLAPVVDLLRDPRYGRAYETMGEDPFLTGSLAIAIAGAMNKRTEAGYQMVQPTMKHFLGYNNEINRIWTNSVMTQRNMREYYFKNFKYPVEAGVTKAVMNAYHLINGKPMMVNAIQGEALLKEWTPDYPDTGHYEFTVVTDFHNPQNLYFHNQRFYYDDPAGRALSAADSIKNGTIGFGEMPNLVMPTIYEAVARGMVSLEDIDELVRRTFVARLRTGDLDHFDLLSPYNKPGSYGTVLSNISEHKKLALEASQESAVLLKNDGILPLKGAKTKHAVVLGLVGDTVLRDHYSPNYPYQVTIKDAFENKLGKGNVAFSRGVDTIAIKAANGQYLVNPNSQYRNAAKGFGQSTGGQTGADTPDGDRILARGGAQKPAFTEKEKLFEVYDYGSNYILFRTPINELFAQISYDGKFVNNTSAPGEGDNDVSMGFAQPLAYVNYQKFGLAKLQNGKTAIYNYVAGNGGMAFDSDDEELNHGSFIGLAGAEGNIVPLGGPGPIDTPERLGSLKPEQQFNFEIIKSKKEAIREAVSALPPDAVVVLALGYEPHLNAREAVDLYQCGLGEAQMEVINYTTGELGRDIILVVKTGSPMTVTEEIHRNPRVKAILHIGQSCQEEGAALISALFDDGYQGASPGYTGFVPFAPPAGRLTATWYKAVSDMPGASTDHRPASYRHPGYDETANDNVSKMNGTINTGIQTYDIIKGKRTYQYFDGQPLYPFGYGLTYTEFDYSALTPVKTGENTLTLSVRIKNTGPYPSDEVAQFYGFYDPRQSRKPRFEQPQKRLIAFERLRNIQPGETRTLKVEVDLLDKLGVWDFTRDQFWVEPGDYVFQAARSSADPRAAEARLTLAGEECPHQVFTGKHQWAEKFDDYSGLGQMEMNHCSYDGSTAVLLNADKAWISYRDIDFTGDKKAALFTALAAAERDTELLLYAGNPGGGGKLVKAIAVPDTRPDKSLPPGLGIGPGMDRDDPAFLNKPRWIKIAEPLDLGELTDLYIQTARRGLSIAWFKFAQGPDKTEALRLEPHYRQNSLRVRQGVLPIKAILSPPTSLDGVSWSVTTPEGQATNLAAIDDEGRLSGAGVGNGPVRVWAFSNGKTAWTDILVTNQLEENKCDLGGQKLTVDFPVLKYGPGISDSILRKNGTSQETVYFRAPEKDYDQVSFDTLDPDLFEWTLTGLDDQPTGIAAVDQTGLVRALGIKNGLVKVTAVYKKNQHIRAARILAVQNQEAKNAFGLIQAEHYDSREPPFTPPPGVPSFFRSAFSDTGPAFGPGGNEMGLYLNAEDKTVFCYRDLNLGQGGREFLVRLAARTEAALDIWVNAPGEDQGGRLLASLKGLQTGSDLTYKTFSVELEPRTPGGTHDVFLKCSGSSRINWFLFA
jgi:beta-glucosidase